MFLLLKTTCCTNYVDFKHHFFQRHLFQFSLQFMREALTNPPRRFATTLAIKPTKTIRTTTVEITTIRSEGNYLNVSIKLLFKKHGIPNCTIKSNYFLWKENFSHKLLVCASTPRLNTQNMLHTTWYLVRSLYHISVGFYF